MLRSWTQLRARMPSRLLQVHSVTSALRTGLLRRRDAEQHATNLIFTAAVCSCALFAPLTPHTCARRILGGALGHASVRHSSISLYRNVAIDLVCRSRGPACMTSHSTPRIHTTSSTLPSVVPCNVVGSCSSERSCIASIRRSPTAGPELGRWISLLYAFLPSAQSAQPLFKSLFFLSSVALSSPVFHLHVMKRFFSALYISCGGTESALA